MALRLPPRAPPNEAPDGIGTPRSTTSSTSTYSSMQVAAEAVAPELLLVRIATQGLKRLAMRKAADYRKLAECTASYAYETVCDVIGGRVLPWIVIFGHCQLDSSSAR